MNVEFKTEELKSFYLGEITGKPRFQLGVLKQYRKVIDYMMASPDLPSMKKINSLRIHPLERELVGKWAARVNEQYRIVFSLEEKVVQVILIEDLTDYH